MYLVNDPSGVEHVLVRRAHHYKKGIGLKHARRLLGNGLLVSEGERWRNARGVVRPLFAPRTRANHLAVSEAAVGPLLERWVRHRHGEDTIDAATEARALAWEMMCATLLGRRPRELTDDVARAIDTETDHAIARMQSPFAFVSWLPTTGNRRAARAAKTIDGAVAQLVSKGRADDDTVVDGLRRGLASHGPRELRDEIVTLWVASYDTTASAIAWTLALLAASPEVQRRAASEAAGIRSGEVSSLVHRLKYCRAIVLEALRLFPPVWILPRESLQDDVVLGTRVSRGSGVIVSPFALHRDERLWGDPDAFRPERFMDGCQRPPKYCYLPFGLGPRHCIGKDLATLQLTCLVALVAARFELSGRPPMVHRVEPSLTLRPRGELLVTCRARQPS
jgi:enediyne biosynthesis protein E7